MPLLTCPNDNAPMQPVRREGVEIDICTQCRGVWLDRGELEKLLSHVRAVDDVQSHRFTPQRPTPSQDVRRDHDRDSYRDDDESRRRKRKDRFDIFDIFD
ncbi:MAG: zf-TFIIB domain-containing protein [Hyphomonadaceae bacterium]|nr:zf-TFIIB domain-containing protein [Hyphomonadaceae bacterium]